MDANDPFFQVFRQFRIPMPRGEIPMQGVGSAFMVNPEGESCKALREFVSVSESELARRMQVNEKDPRRMLDPRHPARVPALERALAVLGRRAEAAVS